MSGNYIPIITKDETSKIFIEKVTFIEQELRKTVIYTDEDRCSCYAKIGDFIKYLDGRFFECHQSYIINMDKVVKMREQTIFFENGHQITLGRDKFKHARQKFSGYIIQGANAITAQKILARGLGL